MTHNSSGNNPNEKREPSRFSKGFKKLLGKGKSQEQDDSPRGPHEESFHTGLKTLHNPESADVDIIFIHGLTGDRDRTWTAAGATAPWPQSLLPIALPTARICSFGYDASVVSWKGMVSQNQIANHASNLLTTLASYRENDDGDPRPIIFVCHSLGGLVCEDALVLSNDRQEPHLKNIIDSTHGIIFLGTPHHGAGLALWAEKFSRYLGSVKQTNSNIVQVLRCDSEVLARIQASFHNIIKKNAAVHPIEISCFYEELPLPGIGPVVPKHSAILAEYVPIGIHANHMGMTKFASANDPGFVAVCGELKRWIKKAGTKDKHFADAHSQRPHEKDIAFLKDLEPSTDPIKDKKRIERDKGGLVMDSSHWILNHDCFKNWCDNEEKRLLWLKGDPGKGKTMMLCGIIDELKNKLPKHTHRVSFFFCQATDTRLSNAKAVLRGLIYQLLHENPPLIDNTRKEYDERGKQVFNDHNAWETLSGMLIDILNDPSMRNVYLVVDALDECETDLCYLLDIIRQLVETTSTKLLVSSRYKDDIEQALGGVDSLTKLDLEQMETAAHVSQAVDTYITQRVSDLKYLYGETQLQDRVSQRMRSKADGTFLWAALIVQELQKAKRWNILSILNATPAGLDKLYDRMIQKVRDEKQYWDYCSVLLWVVTSAYRPLHLEELHALAKLEPEIADLRDLVEMVNLCGSFLTIRDDIVYFTHLSAKDYLIGDNHLFPFGVAARHDFIASRSICLMSEILRRDIYNLQAPGFSVDHISPPKPDPLRLAQYVCVYWVDHLAQGNSFTEHLSTEKTTGALEESVNADDVMEFLKVHMLHWLEALSLMRKVPEGVTAVEMLLAISMRTEAPELQSFASDARRFVLSHKRGFEIAPLQVYSSALIFSPTNSLVRRSFNHEIPAWIKLLPKVEAEWSGCLQTIEGHQHYIDSITAVGFSVDGKRIASSSSDYTVKLWDATSGNCLRTLTGEGRWDVHSLEFSPDGDSIVLGLTGGIEIRDTNSGHMVKQLHGHGWVYAVAYSPDGSKIAACCNDGILQIWDANSFELIHTTSHNLIMKSISFLASGSILVSESAGPKTIISELKNTTGEWVTRLEIDGCGYSVAISSSGGQVALGFESGVLEVWDTTSGQCVQRIKASDHFIRSLAFSPDGRQVASGSDILQIWDIENGKNLRAYKPDGYHVNAVTFSRDGGRVVSGSDNVQIWANDSRHHESLLEDHKKSVNRLILSPDLSQIASSSDDKTIKIWDSASGDCIRTFTGHDEETDRVAFSPDGKRVASGSYDKTIRIWDIASNDCLAAMPRGDIGTMSWQRDNMGPIVFSTDGQQVMTSFSGYGMTDGIIKVYCISSGTCIQTQKAGRKLPIGFSSSHRQTGSNPSNKAITEWEVDDYTCDWVGLNGRPVLWLPREFRPVFDHSGVAAAGSTVAIGTISGRVLIMEFALDVDEAIPLFKDWRARDREH